MQTRKKRIRQWIAIIIISIYLISVGNESEKQELTVYAPLEMEEAFKDALKLSELKETHKIVMTDDPNSNICVECGKQNDKNYQEIAFSPFVVAYDYDNKALKKLIKSGVCSESKYKDECYEIDLKKIIKEASDKGKWENLGLEELGELKVFYPDKESAYWNDFYDFLLVTVNDGEYPDTEEEFEAAEKAIDEFINSKSAKGIKDFNEQVRRTGGFPNNAIYILPESELVYICTEQGEYSILLFPLNTVYLNYYIKGDDLGNKLIEAFDKKSIFNDFYYSLNANGFRNYEYSEKHEFAYITYERDVYNAIEIPEKKEFTPSKESE